MLEFVNHNKMILKRNFKLKNDESIFLNTENDMELKKFFGEKGGWCLAKSDTIFCDAYYFCMAEMQIGGDHAY